MKQCSVQNDGTARELPSRPREKRTHGSAEAEKQHAEFTEAGGGLEVQVRGRRGIASVTDLWFGLCVSFAAPSWAVLSATVVDARKNGDSAMHE